MKDDAQKLPGLSAGQLWRLGNRFVRIVSLEELCVRFKLLDAPDDIEEKTLTGDCDTLLRYLMARKGVLVG